MLLNLYGKIVVQTDDMVFHRFHINLGSDKDIGMHIGGVDLFDEELNI